MDEEELLLRISQYDKDAFHELYERTSKAVYSYILSVVKSPQDAEEILQDTYLKVWMSAGSYLPQGKPLAWLFTIARNLCYMEFRARGRESGVSYEDLTGEETGELCQALEWLPETIVLRTVLGKLKEEERKIVLLHAGAGMKHREIAESLGIPQSTVLSKYHRAMKKLRNILEEEQGT